MRKEVHKKKQAVTQIASNIDGNGTCKHEEEGSDEYYPNDDFLHTYYLTYLKSLFFNLSVLVIIYEFHKPIEVEMF